MGGGMPGARVMVFVAAGFVSTMMVTSDSSSLIDRANHANIVINTIDARGLYTPDVTGDISDPPHDSMRTAGIKSSYRVQAQLAQSDILGQLADGTGGTFFHNRNDIDEGLREATAAPAMSYLLGFSPQNLKVNGAYHTLKVTLAGKQKLNVQARHGYYAPRTIKDPAEAAKEEIQEALFSQDEIRDLPVELQTQFFKKDQSQARLAVLTHVDVKGIRFRKADGRNRDDLTVATAIFDENGNFVTGGEKIVEMKLLDTTFERLSHSGFTLKSSFDVKPGTYLVRMVVRDAEGAQMAARNGAVSIPYYICRFGGAHENKSDGKSCVHWIQRGVAGFIRERTALGGADSAAGASRASGACAAPDFAGGDQEGIAVGAGGRGGDGQKRKLCSRPDRQGFQNL